MIRVLIVDDHQMVAESLERLLEDDPKIEVIGAAATAQEGVDRVHADQPDVVLMDFQLPDMNGAEATRIIKADFPQILVIALTGSGHQGAYHAAMEAGSSAWVNKTRAVHDLKAVVHRVILGETIASQEYGDEPTLDQLVVQYQPVIELETGRIVGAEALVRWQHPSRGLLYPVDFLPLAEETGFVVEIGKWIGERAARQNEIWHRKFRSTPDLWVSVNMSASGMSVPTLTGDVSDIVKSAGIDPATFVIEVTETMLLEDTPQVTTSLQELNGIGVRLSLDDFGSGFSSLSYLRRFPFDFIKIDTAFTADIPGSPRAMLLVEAIQNLATTTGISAIAEGIERPDQELALESKGWKLGQGYLYSRAVAPASFEALLAARGLDSHPGA